MVKRVFIYIVAFLMFIVLGPIFIVCFILSGIFSFLGIVFDNIMQLIVSMTGINN